MSKRVAIPVSLVAFTLMLGACASPSPSPAVSGEATGSPAEVTPVPTPAPPPPGGRLALVQGRGELICGINGGLPGFSFLDQASGENTGFDADFCRAVAAAVLGDPEAVEFRATTADQRSTALQSGEIDVLIRNTTWTVSRDTSWGLFAPTTFYDGQGMMVREADDITSLEDLEGATICVQSGTTTELNLADQMRVLGVEFTPSVFDNIEQTYSTYDEGNCDAVTSDRSQLVSQRTIMTDPAEHVILEVVMSKEPLGPVVPLGDDAWFNIVKWVVFATIEAEEQGITSDNVEEMRDTSENPVVRRLLGAEGELGIGLGLQNDWVVDVILAVGNYGEIYDRNLGPGTDFDLERGPNNLWTEGGLLYAPPYR
jgi:general L-amino acid transport system substrate-binding protein